MGHRSWMGDQRFGTTQTHRQLHDLKIIEQRKSLLLAALDVEGKGRTGRGTLPIEYKLARIALFEKAEIVNLGDLGMARQIFGDEPRVVICARHADLQRFKRT